jgi:deoxycytidylate deaminase
MAKLALAIEMANLSTMISKHGAVMFSGSLENGKIFSTGYNNNDTSKIKYFSLNHLNGIHAEIDCLLSCKNIFSFRKTLKESRRKFNMLVVRCKCDGLGESKPCSLCHSLLRKFRIKKIYYSTASGEIKMMKVNDPIEKIFITKGLSLKMKSQSTCRSIIMNFIQKLSKDLE